MNKMKRPLPDTIWNYFQTTGKRHLFLSGSFGSGKSTLALELESRMQEGFLSLKQAALSDSPWVFLDEIGYLEESCPEFLTELFALMEKKSVLGVLRKDSGLFHKIANRKDVFLYDLDEPILSVGCVVMASGLGRRFHETNNKNSVENKLLADFRGEPLIQPILRQAKTLPFTDSIVVARQKEVAFLAEKEGLEALLHQLPDRNDTLRLGLTHLLEKHPDLSGCLFCVGDQPLLKRETLEMLLLAFSHNPDKIVRTGSPANPGNPILFPAKFFPELLHLPPKKGGGFLAKKYPEQVQYVPVRDAFELVDVDTAEDLEKLSTHFLF